MSKVFLSVLAVACVVFVAPVHAGAAGTDAQTVLSNIELQQRLAREQQEAEQALRESQAAGDEQGSQSAQKALEQITGALSKMGQGIMDSNFQCVPVVPVCGCGQIMTSKGCRSGPNKFLCPCYQPTPVGTIPGICIANQKCEGQSAPGSGGTSNPLGNIGQFTQLLDQVKGLLGGGQGGGGGGDYGSYTDTGTQGCTSYYQVTAPSSDPCAYYVPPTSNSIDTSDGIGSSASDILLNALGGGSSDNGSSQGLINAINNAESRTQTSTTSTSTSSGGGQVVNLQAGTEGDITLDPVTGATIFARSRDAQSNTEVAGFYGSTISGNNQPQGLAARMCQSRPWSGAVVSFVIPPTFFDSLCASRGYQVGAPEPVVQQTTAISSVPEVVATTTLQQQSISTVEPEVDIWAVPTDVPLGSRTSIFWNTKGVTSCFVSSPAGNFEERALSGGAATVPLTNETTFTIVCTSANGETIEDSVVVGLSI